MAKTVDITIDENGDVEINLEGFHGVGCAAIAEGMMKAINGSAAGVVKKSDYHKPEQTKNRLNSCR